MDKVHIGTSGWYYDHWKGPFYPKTLKKDHFLEFYADRFKTVEINSSFYHLPQESNHYPFSKVRSEWGISLSVGFLCVLEFPEGEYDG